MQSSHCHTTDGGLFDETVRLNEVDKTERLIQTPKEISNWIMSDLSGLLNSAGIEIQDAKVKPAHLIELIQLIKDQTINGKIAKSVLSDVFETGNTPQQIVEEKELSQISDVSAIESIVDRVIEENPGPAQDYRMGSRRQSVSLVGQVMKGHQRQSQPADGQPAFETKT